MRNHLTVKEATRSLKLTVDTLRYRLRDGAIHGKSTRSGFFRVLDARFFLCCQFMSTKSPFRMHITFVMLIKQLFFNMINALCSYFMFVGFKPCQR